MREDYTDIAIVLDESGSMQSTKKDAIGGFNQFLEDQKALPGIATLTLVKFNTNYNFVCNGIDLNSVIPIDEKSYFPGGGTALLDAIGRTINEVGTRLSQMQEQDRPSKVIIVIITDGEENSSRIYNAAQIKEMINHQEEVYKWQFVFIGSNQDAITTASSYGFRLDSSLNLGIGGEALKLGYQSVSKSISNLRSGAASAAVFSNEDRTIQNALGAYPNDPKSLADRLEAFKKQRQSNDDLRSRTDDSGSWSSK